MVGQRIEIAGGGQTSVRQNYFVTFEFPNGERRERYLAPAGYGLLAEGDPGQVWLQGMSG